LKRCCVLEDHYDDERNKTTPDCKTKTDFSGLRPVLS